MKFIEKQQDDFDSKRIKEIINDKFSKPFLYLIGRENGMEENEVEEKKNTKEFEEMIRFYFQREIKRYSK